MRVTVEQAREAVPQGFSTSFESSGSRETRVRIRRLVPAAGSILRSSRPRDPGTVNPLRDRWVAWVPALNSPSGAINICASSDRNTDRFQTIRATANILPDRGGQGLPRHISHGVRKRFVDTSAPQRMQAIKHVQKIFGCRDSRPSARSKASPARSKVASSNGRAISCTPIGRPALCQPLGMVIAG